MERRTRDRVVVVTGASAGVGRAVARAFGAEGAKVALVARTREALENAAREIARAGGQAMVLPLDVADAAAVERAADEVVARWGRIDVWGYAAQQTDEPVSPDRGDDVDHPLPGDRGAHGDFDARAKGWSGELWFRMNRRRIAGAAVAVAAAVLGDRALTA